MKRWILVADSAAAEIFEEDRDGLIKVHRLEHAASQEHSKDLMGNRPGQNQHHMEKGLKGDEADSLREDESLKFAREVSTFLHTAYSQNRFRKLVVVADPRSLGRLRELFAAPVASAVDFTINKRALQMRGEELAELVSGGAS